MIHPDPQTGHMIKVSFRKSHLRVTHQQVDSIDHVITNISRDMIMSVHNKIDNQTNLVICRDSSLRKTYKLLNSGFLSDYILHVISRFAQAQASWIRKLINTRLHCHASQLADG